MVEKRRGSSPLFDAWLAGVPEGQKCAKGQKRIKGGAKSKRFFNQCVDALCECLGILDIARF